MSLPPRPRIEPFPADDEVYAAWLGQALARAATCGPDVPVGALVIDPAGVVVATGINRREVDGDPTAHAEIVALRAATAGAGDGGEGGNDGGEGDGGGGGGENRGRRWSLEGHTLVVTLEPCAMCAGALVAARIARVVFGAWDLKAGACGSVWDIVRDRRAPHRIDVVGGIREPECARLLNDFFAARRLR